MRLSGVYRTGFAVLAIFYFSGAAQAELAINPYPDAPPPPTAVNQPVQQETLPQTETLKTEAPSDSAAPPSENASDSFNIEAYYARFNKKEDSAIAEPEAIVHEQTTEPVAEKTASGRYEEEQYAEEISKAKEDLARIKEMTQTELERQQEQIETLKSEKAELERQAAELATLRTEKEELKQKAAQTEALFARNASLEQQTEQMKQLQQEKAALEQEVAHIEALQAEKAELERQASRVEELRAENVSLAQQAAQLEAMRSEDVSSEVKDAEAEVLRAKKDLLEQQLQYAKIDYEKMDTLEKKVNLLEEENKDLRQSLIAMAEQGAQSSPQSQEQNPQDYQEVVGLEPQSSDASQVNQKFEAEPYRYEKEIDINSYYGRHAQKPSEVTAEKAFPEYRGRLPTADELTGIGSEGSEWFADKGKNVEDVLRDWCEEAGVQFVWDTGNQFSVLENLAVESNYEDAVAALLGQYMGNNIRPVGSLHVNPESGDRILVIEASDRS